VSTIEQPQMEVDGDKLMQFVFRAVDEVGATLNSALVVMGDRLGLYRSLTDSSSPAYLSGSFQIAVGSVLDSPKIVEAARTGEGVGWHEHVHDVHEGCERFFRPGYNAHLIAEWLPALDGVVATLERAAPTTTTARSRPRGRERRTRGWPTGSSSTSRRRRRTMVPATTSSRCSTACTTWEIRSVPHAKSVRRSLGRGPG
jgi:hypothetical protein